MNKHHQINPNGMCFFASMKWIYGSKFHNLVNRFVDSVRNIFRSDIFCNRNFNHVPILNGAFFQKQIIHKWNFQQMFLSYMNVKSVHFFFWIFSVWRLTLSYQLINIIVLKNANLSEPLHSYVSQSNYPANRTNAHNISENQKGKVRFVRHFSSLLHSQRPFFRSQKSRTRHVFFTLCL